MKNTLNFHEIYTNACELAGHSKLNDDAYIHRVSAWIKCVETEGNLTAHGVESISQLLTGWIAERLYWQHDVSLHPEIGREEISQPIFITGMPRTGTTKLQRVLSCDSKNQHLPLWQILNPSRRLIENEKRSQKDPRILIANEFIELLKKSNSSFLTAHPMFSEEAEEESFLIESDLKSLSNCTRVRAPSYWNAIKDQTTRESYDFLKSMLQYIQWQRGSSNTPWILKSPLHIGRLKNLLEVFPDALVIHCIRDPLVSLPSNCRIVEAFRSLSSDNIDLQELGIEQLNTWSTQLNVFTDSYKDIPKSHLIHARYDDIQTKVQSVIARVYAQLNRPVSNELLSQLKSWEKAHPQHEFGQHKYSLERYSLDPASVEQAFHRYRSEFIKNN